MPTINVQERKVQVKVVYYGPARSGKTTNLEALHELGDARSVSDLIQLKTEGDRTLFFDLLPLVLGEVGGLALKTRLFTVPGQAFHRATRRLVLRDADVIVFVGDLDPARIAENAESLADLHANLAANGIRPGTVPLVLQGNKSDLPGALSPADFVERLDLSRLGVHRDDLRGEPIVASALAGEGVVETFETALRLVLRAANARAGERRDSPWAALERQLARNVAAWHGRRRVASRPAVAACTSEAVPPTTEALLEASVQRSVQLAESLGDQRLVEAKLLRSVEELETLATLTRSLATGPDESGVAHAVAVAALSALPSGVASVLLADPSGVLREAALVGLAAEPLLESGRDETLSVLLRSDGPRVFVGDEVASVLGPTSACRKSFAVVAVRAGDGRRGLVCVHGNRSDRTDAPQVERLLAAIASAAVLGLDGARQRSELLSHRERLEIEVEERTADLRRAQEENVALSGIKDRLLATVNHELRTPVAKLLATAQVLERAGAEAPPALVGGLVKHARHLGRIIDQVTCAQALLSPPVEEGGNDGAPATAELGRVIEAAVLACLDVALERRVVITRQDVPPETAWIAGDGRSATLALSPLVENAVKFSPPDGEVILLVRPHGPASVRLFVVDQGRGVPAADAERVFAELDQGSGDFLTQKPAGLGLGLAIARRAARRIGGDVGIDAAVEGRRGATFWLELRVAAAMVPVVDGVLG